MTQNIFKFKTETKLEEKFRVKATIGKHTFIIDEPQELGGTGKGPNPVELLLASLASCLIIATSYHAMVKRIKIKSIKAEAEGTLDIRGFIGTDNNVRPGFQEITVNLKIDSDEPEEKIRELIEFVEEHCPVRDTLIKGIKITLNLESRKSSCCCA